MAKQAHPNATWWLKGDGVDVVKGLFESTSGVWSGDVDLNNGEPGRQYREMNERLNFVKGLGLHERRFPTIVSNDLLLLLERSKADSKFVLEGMCKMSTNNTTWPYN
jgi:hypothetical protein